MNPTYDVSFEKTRDNLTTVKVNGYYLHSKFKPSLEGAKLAEEAYQPHHLHIIFGYGMGYLVDSLLDKRIYNEPIIVIDPLIDNGTLKIKDYTNQNVYVFKTKEIEEIRNNIGLLAGMTNKMTFIVSPNYKKIFLTEVHEIANLVKEAQERELVNIHTMNHFAVDWQINYAMNLKKMVQDHSLNELAQKYNCPIVVASSGPSLTKQLPLLKMYRNRFILICAGSTINSLLDAGIIPNYVVSIDGGINNFRHFENLSLKNIELIYSPILHYKVRESFKENAFLFIPHSRPQFEKNLNDKVNRNFPIMSGGGSVAHFALSIAKFITTGPICLIGQDLAYTNNQTHSAGNKNNEVASEVSKVMVEGYYGEKVCSSKIFKGMINTFEDLNMAQPHSNKVFNCTEGGAKVNGYSQISFKQFLESYATSEVERISLDKLEKYKTETILENEFKLYDEILKLLNKGLRVIKNENGVLFSKKGIAKIGEIESNLNKLYEKSCMDILLEPIITSAEHRFLPSPNESKYDEFKRVKEYITVLYTESIEMIEKYIERLNEILKEESEEK